MLRRFRLHQSLLAVLVATGLLSCTRGDDGQVAGDSVVAASPPPSSGGVAPLQHLPNFPDAQGDDLANYVAQIDLFKPDNAEDYARLTTVKYNCAACPGRQATFLIVPVRNSRQIKWERELVGNSQSRAEVVAAFINIEKVEVAELQLKAEDHMYVWIGHIHGADARGIGLFTYNSAAKTKTWVNGTKIFSRCPEGTDNDKPSAKIKPAHANCASVPDNADGGPLPVSALVGRPRHPDGLWLSCTGGCCKSTLE